MNLLNEWINSGMYVFILMSEQGYQASEPAQNAWPDAIAYGDYRLINFDKVNAKRFTSYLLEQGYTLNYGLGDTVPMLLTWEEALQFASTFTMNLTFKIGAPNGTTTI